MYGAASKRNYGGDPRAAVGTKPRCIKECRTGAWASQTQPAGTIGQNLHALAHVCLKPKAMPHHAERPSLQAAAALGARLPNAHIPAHACPRPKAMLTQARQARSTRLGTHLSKILHAGPCTH